MVRLINFERKEIARKRLRFLFYEITSSFLLILLLSSILWGIFSLFSHLNLAYFGILFYVLRALIIFGSVSIILWLYNKIISSQKRNREISPLNGYLRLFKITKKNFKYQILYGLLLFFLVLLPIDFMTYGLFPEVISYQAYSLGLNSLNAYLLIDNYSCFLLASIIIQISVSFSQESIYRGFLAKRGTENFYKMSAVIISSISFGLGNFTFYFNPLNVYFSQWLPIFLSIESFIIGMILSIVTLSRKWLIPSIFAYSLKNIISYHTLWNFLQGNEFIVVELYLYVPALIGGIILFIWQFSRIKESLSTGFKTLREYTQKEEKNETTNTDKYFRYFFDILIGILIFLVSLLIAI